ncbi:MAG: hypothetical protein DWQ09_13440 [Proteobacteria bacterium]|nr:MAG: hypothetical protein DWQ09_13440 [Pseudomonadota bacterium]QKK12480.1 MAG: hypothetical protein HND59_13695 [Pseudomonadota bacterium]
MAGNDTRSPEATQARPAEGVFLDDAEFVRVAAWRWHHRIRVGERNLAVANGAPIWKPSGRES